MVSTIIEELETLDISVRQFQMCAEFEGTVKYSPHCNELLRSSAC